MPDFTVDIGGLDALVKNIDRSAENIDTVTKRLANLETNEVGPEDLERACSDFRDDWKDGLGEMEDAMDEVREGLEGAKGSYQDIEDTIAENLKKMEDRLDGNDSQ